MIWEMQRIIGGNGIMGEAENCGREWDYEREWRIVGEAGNYENEIMG